MKALARAWVFARRPQNLALIIALGGGLGFLIHLAIERHDRARSRSEPAVAQAAQPPPPAAAPAGPVTISATADHGAIAAATVGDGARTQVNGPGQKK